MDHLSHNYHDLCITCLWFNEHIDCFVVLFVHSGKLVQSSKKSLKTLPKLILLL